VSVPRGGDTQLRARQRLASPTLAREERGFWCQGGLCQAALKAAGDELSAKMRVGEHVPSCSRLGGLSVPAWPSGQGDLAGHSGLSRSLWLCPSSSRYCALLHQHSRVLGVWVGGHSQTRHQGLIGFLQALLKLGLPCRQGGLRARLVFSFLSIACEQKHGDSALVDHLIMR